MGRESTGPQRRDQGHRPHLCYGVFQDGRRCEKPGTFPRSKRDGRQQTRFAHIFAVPGRPRKRQRDTGKGANTRKGI